MIDTTLKDGTRVQAQWTNKDPNYKGIQQHTNGAAPAWVSFDGGAWMRSYSSDGKYPRKVQEAIESIQFKNELIELLELKEY